MILTRLHWPPASPAWVTVKSQEEDLSLKEALSGRQRQRKMIRRAMMQDLYHIIQQGDFIKKQQRATESGPSPEIEQLKSAPPATGA
jgi:hypothetical protein